MKRFLFLFSSVFLLSLLAEPKGSFAQTAWIDTNYIKAHVDSCRRRNTSEEKIKCSNDLLKLLELDRKTVKNQKEKICLDKAQVNSLRNIGTAYREISISPKALNII